MWHIDSDEATKVGPINNARPKEIVIEEEEPDFVDPYDFDMSNAIQHSSGENGNSDSSNIY